MKKLNIYINSSGGDVSNINKLKSVLDKIKPNMNVIVVGFNCSKLTAIQELLKSKNIPFVVTSPDPYKSKIDEFIEQFSDLNEIMLKSSESFGKIGDLISLPKPEKYDLPQFQKIKKKLPFHK